MFEEFTVGNDFAASGINSLFMIIVTELGDKTFFIAAVLAMRAGRLVVYAGAMGKSWWNIEYSLLNIYNKLAALAAMHILSCLMGYALPSFLPRQYTHIASTVTIFLY